PILLTPIPYAITLPATQLGHTIHFGHGRPRFVASRTTILPGRPCTSLPSVGRRTQFFHPQTMYGRVAGPPMAQDTGPMIQRCCMTLEYPAAVGENNVVRLPAVVCRWPQPDPGGGDTGPPVVVPGAG